MIDAIRLLLLIGLAVFSLITFLLMIAALEESGVKPSLFLYYIGTLVDFIYLTKDTQDEKKRSYYRRLLWAFFLSITLLIGTALTFMAVPWRH